MKDSKTKLIKLLQKAYSGERAAALAYNGHWKSLKDEKEIRIVRRIEQDEWRHREQIKRMLDEMSARPLFFREIIFYLIGRFIGIVCHFCGKFCAAFFAAILESKNVRDYSIALKYCEETGLDIFFEDLREMEKAEAEHEVLLREMIRDNWFFPLFATVFRLENPPGFVNRKQNARF